MASSMYEFASVIVRSSLLQQVLNVLPQPHGTIGRHWSPFL